RTAREARDRRRRRGGRIRSDATLFQSRQRFQALTLNDATVDEIVTEADDVRYSEDGRLIGAVIVAVDRTDEVRVGDVVVTPIGANGKPDLSAREVMDAVEFGHRFEPATTDGRKG